MEIVGTFLTFGGMSVALGGLRYLRQAMCPRCEATGTLITVHQVVEGSPAGWPMQHRLRHCGQCGATVEDVREIRSRRPRGAIGRRLLSALSG